MAESLFSITAEQVGSAPRQVKLDRSLIFMAVFPFALAVLLAGIVWFIRKDHEAFENVKLAALQARGRITTARIKSVEIRPKGLFGYERDQRITSVYYVDGVEYQTGGAVLDANNTLLPKVGTEFPVTYLPESPAIHELGKVERRPALDMPSPVELKNVGSLKPPSEIVAYTGMTLVIIGGVLILIVPGIGLCVLPGVLRRRHLLRWGTAVNAKITRMALVGSKSIPGQREFGLFANVGKTLANETLPNELYELTFQFEPAEGQTISGGLQFFGYLIKRAGLTVGSRIMVIYDPKQPRKFVPYVDCHFVSLSPNAAAA